METTNNAANDIIELRCKFKSKRYEKPNSDWTISIFIDEDGNEFAATGNGLPATKNVPAILYGKWESYKGQTNFHVKSFTLAQPTNKAEMVAYCISLKCGIGQKSAELLYDHFGTDLIDALQNKPERVKKIAPRVRPEALRERLESTTVIRDLMSFFGNSISLPMETLRKIATKWGGDAITKIQKNPYKLAFIHGIGFNLAEQVAVAINSPAVTGEARTVAAIIYVLQHCTVEGHVYLTQEQLLQKVQALCSKGPANLVPPEEQILNYAAILTKKHFIVVDEEEGAFYDRAMNTEERQLAANIARIAYSPLPESEQHIEGSSVRLYIAEYELSEGITLASKQRDAVVSAVTSTFSVITGGAGTGKTTVVKCLLWVLRKKLKEAETDIVLAAPTGRAARRMSEVTYMSAQTVHKAANIRVDGAGGTAIVKDEDGCEKYGIEAKTIIVDEASMLDQHIANEFLTQVLDGTRVVFLGDPGQLPSVGAGNVLNEIISSNCIPTVKLDQIFRQAEDNPIVHNSLMVQKGSDNFIWSRQFQMHEATGAENILNAAVNFYLRCVKQFGLEEVILLNPYRKGTLTVDMFNERIQARINPPDPGKPEMRIKGTTFRVGDRVMQTKNRVEVANGDIGVVKRIYKTLSNAGCEEYVCDIVFDGNITETYNATEMESIRLSYCTSVHKSQGGQWKCVIMILFHEHRNLLQRNLLYTGITRAREGVALFGEKWCIPKAVENNVVTERNTLLSVRLHEACKHMKSGNRIRAVSFG